MTCSTCLFFNDSQSECRRNAPIPVGHRQYAQWPKVKETDWCGQYRKAGSSAEMEPLEHANEGCGFNPDKVAAE